ncbi:response regulator [Trinickia violacea]|uniref:Response regulator n=1 Tax=Trinickia violacea TaxID=2571746 RepID=A0A4P8ISF3_9BURK|nr:response regulator [Trinickia violacea]QCP51306.1 response regulator [Trinickia violacea]
MQHRMKVVVADDHPVILLGAEQALMKFPDVEVVARAGQSTELIKVLQTVPADVLVTDLAMPGGQYGDGLPLISYILRHFSGLRIVVLTMLENAALLKRLGEIGVIAVVNKSDDLAHIGLAVRHVMRDLPYASPSVRASLATLRMNAGGKTDEVILSRRELEVVRLFVSGMTVKEISTQLNRSIKTISTQKNMAMRKLGLERDSELLQYAQGNGLMNLSSGGRERQTAPE